MTKWVVTGYSPKLDGILCIVEAETMEAAFEKVARQRGLMHFQVPQHGNCDVMVAEADVPTLIDDMDQGNGRFFEVATAEYEENVNLNEAVLW